MTPVTALAGTVARTSVKLANATGALSRELVGPAKVTVGVVEPTIRLEPVMVTNVPMGPVLGLKSAIAGGCPPPRVKATPFDVPAAV